MSIDDGYFKILEAFSEFKVEINNALASIKSDMRIESTRLDAHKDLLIDLKKRLEAMEEHIGFIKAICSFARVIRGKSG